MMKLFAKVINNFQPLHHIYFTDLSICLCVIFLSIFVKGDEAVSLLGNESSI